MVKHLSYKQAIGSRLEHDEGSIPSGTTKQREAMKRSKHHFGDRYSRQRPLRMEYNCFMCGTEVKKKPKPRDARNELNAREQISETENWN